ncbi:MAG: methionyl-tRNA formyltransferase [Candidatus Magasanikbacteria bacterium]|nr:methionyl-tRNA formyltransferase [Candidatus Magasanikbacteria bacterium]
MNDRKIRAIFFGTHEFAATILEGLISSPFITVELVITQPDKPVGRKKELKKSPVKILAEKYDLPIIQPASLRIYQLPISDYHIAIVAQYGIIIPKKLLDDSPHGFLNVHTSLLPKYRGASPIQSALINGETETGVTIMKMDEGLDTGPIILQKPIKIGEHDTYIDLDKKLAEIGKIALLEAIPKYISGELEPIPQDNLQASTCGQFTRDDGKIDWTKSATDIYNRYRGLNPWPGIWTSWKNKRLKLIKIKPVDLQIEAGKVVLENGKMYIGCAKNAIEVLKLQLEGKKAMDVEGFLRGYQKIASNILN